MLLMVVTAAVVGAASLLLAALVGPTAAFRGAGTGSVNDEEDMTTSAAERADDSGRRERSSPSGTDTLHTQRRQHRNECTPYDWDSERRAADGSRPLSQCVQLARSLLGEYVQ